MRKINLKKILNIVTILGVIFTFIFMIFYTTLLFLKMAGIDVGYFELNNVLLPLIIFSITFVVIAFINLLYNSYLFKKKVDSRYEYREYLLRELELNQPPNTYIDALQLNKSQNEEANQLYEYPTLDEQNENNKKDIIALMLKNNDEITDYFKISKSQARTSFWVSVSSCIFGMVSLGFALYCMLILKDISASIFSFIAGAISEVASGTTFWVHNKSALQLKHFYRELHENEKFLSAVTIADKLSNEKREEVLVDIIYKQIDAKPSKIEADNIKRKKSNPITRAKRKVKNVLLKRQKKNKK